MQEYIPLLKLELHFVERMLWSNGHNKKSWVLYIRNYEEKSVDKDLETSFPDPFWYTRRAHILTGESPEFAQQWEGYSRTAKVSL